MGKSQGTEIQKVGARRDGCMRIIMLIVLIATVMTMVAGSLLRGF